VATMANRMVVQPWDKILGPHAPSRLKQMLITSWNIRL
jgi:hypothetical protein